MESTRAGVDNMGIIAGVGAFAALTLASEDLARALGDGVAPVLALAATVGCIATARRRGGKTRNAWGVLALATLAWGVADAAVLAARLAGDAAASRSFVDTAHLVGAALASVAIVMLSPRRKGRVDDALEALLVFASLLFLATALVVSPLANAGGVPAVTLQSTFAFIVLGSLALFSWSNATGADREAMARVGAGLTVLAIATAGALGLAASGAAEVATSLRGAAAAGYVLVLLAARLASVPSYDEGERAPLAALLPYAPVALAGGVALAGAAAGSQTDGRLLVAAGVTAALLLARQARFVAGSGRAAGATAMTQDQTDEITASEARYRSLVQFSSDVITLLRPDGIIGYQNDAAGRVFGLPPNALVGSRLHDWVHPADRNRLQAVVTDLLRHPGGHERIVVRLQRGDSRWSQSEIELANLCHEPTIGAIALSIRDVTDRLVQQRRPDHESSFDALTGLPNRRLFTRAVGDAVAQRLVPAVVALDIDHFGEINATFGQEAGDRILRGISRRLKSCVRATDFMARIGADEFAVMVLPGDDGVTDPAPVVARIEAMLDEFSGASADEHSSRLTAAIGIAEGEAGQRADEVLTAAMAALAAARQIGSGGRAVFDERLAAAEHARMAIATELRDALRHGDMLFAFQPTVGLDGGDLVSIDSVFRWNHPVRGRLTADEVLAVAMEAGVIDRVTWWMLEELCRVGVSWDSRLEGRPLSLRVSATHAVSGLVPLVAELMPATAVPSGGLLLEIAGAASIDRPVELARAVADLQALGLLVAVDDLHHGAVVADIAIIEPAWVDRIDTDAQAVEDVRSLVELVHVTGGRALAAGVTRESQFEALKAIGCDFGRGPYFGSPVSQDRFEAALGLVGDATPSRLPTGGMKVRPLR